jgi:trk system potassium uptake protein
LIPSRKEGSLVANEATELKYAVRFPVVCKYFGQLCLVLAAMTVVPLVMSLTFGDRHTGLRCGAVIGALAACGTALARLRASSRMQANEGMVVVALMFLVAPLVMSYPLMGSGMGFLDAFFEAVSGVTTTGLSTKATLVGASSTFLFTRAWMQWYGGLGIVIFSLALVMRPGQAAKGLTVTEAEPEDLVGGTRAHARRILKVYGAMTAVGIIGALSVGFAPFDAVVHILAAVSTGGFAPSESSLQTFAWPAQAWITLMGFTGALPLTIYYGLPKERRRAAVELRQIQAIFIACLAVSVAVAATLRFGTGLVWPLALHHAPLLAFSAQTTTGFSSLQLANLDAGTKLILIFAMLVGGGAGSTAGGFKLVRLLIAASALRLIILRTCLPHHAVVEPRLAGRRIHGEEAYTALLIIVLFIAVVALSWLPFVVLGFNPLDSLFEIVSATGTVGLSVGVTSGTLPPLLKGILCIDMLMGRLEIIAWLVILYPGTWFGRRMEGA